MKNVVAICTVALALAVAAPGFAGAEKQKTTTVEVAAAAPMVLEAFHDTERLALAGDVKAMYQVGNMYLNAGLLYNYGGQREARLRSAYEWYQKAAAAGSPEAVEVLKKFQE